MIQMLFNYIITNICKQYLPFHLIHLRIQCLISLIIISIVFILEQQGIQPWQRFYSVAFLQGIVFIEQRFLSVAFLQGSVFIDTPPPVCTLQWLQMPISTFMYLAVTADAHLYLYVPCSNYRCPSIPVCSLQWLHMPISTCYMYLAVATDAHLYLYVPCSGYRCPSLPVCTLQWLLMPIFTFIYLAVATNAQF